MKLNIKIDTNVEEPEALITTARMTEEVNRVADFISGLDNAATVILGMKDGKQNCWNRMRWSEFIRKTVKYLPEQTVICTRSGCGCMNWKNVWTTGLSGFPIRKL